MRISIMGLPGSGKTTLAQILSGMFNVMVISSGDLARAHGFTGSEAESMGQLDPDEAKIRRLVKEAIGNSDQYILDGFPRTIEQIENLQLPLDAVVYLSLPKPYGPTLGAGRLIRRGRPDDTPTTIESRIITYFTHTHPLVDYFLDKELLVYINATGTIAETLRQAVVALAARGIIECSQYIDKLLKEFQDDYRVDPESIKVKTGGGTSDKSEERGAGSDK